jgi:hypothetical protein
MISERRSWERADLRVQVWVLSEGVEKAAYAARNLSGGGALLAEGPLLRSGREVRVMLPLRGRDLVLHARVVRSEPDAHGSPASALSFRGMPTFVQDLIEEHVKSARAGSATGP